VIGKALFEELAEGGVTPEMLDTQEYKNAVTMSAVGPIEKYTKDASDFCLATWQLLGPNGVYKRQMLEAN
jgi:hypothetical protein